MELTRQHFARLREYRRFSEDGRGLGQTIDSPVDEHLAERGFITPGRHQNGWIISDSGIQALEGRESIEAARREPHHDLASRVARWLERQGRLAWLNRSFEVFTRNDLRAVKHLGLICSDKATDPMFLGPMRYVSRPDVISVVPADRRAQVQPWIFEVKVSRRDFLVDVNNPRKRLAYAILAERVYYACPEGLIAVEEVPTGCGLVVESSRGTFQVLAEPPTCKVRHSAHINRLLGNSRLRPR
jgi:hypothetical protein